MMMVLLLHCTYAYNLLNHKILTAKLNGDMLTAKAMKQYGHINRLFYFEGPKTDSPEPLT